MKTEWKADHHDPTVPNEARLYHIVGECPRLPSLRSINSALSDLMQAEQSFTAQIADVVRRDPSLTARILRLVNSVFFGLSKHISNIEDAIFYLGLRHIRELALATPVIEDCAELCPKGSDVDWTQMWKHSIATAMLTREILETSGATADGDSDYIAGLVHNVGSIVIGISFPDEFIQLHRTHFPNADALCDAERELIGWDHATIGAYYLKVHNLSESIVEAVHYHHNPSAAPKQVLLASAIQLADVLARFNGIADFRNLGAPPKGAWLHQDAWTQLYGTDAKRAALRAEPAFVKAARLPTMIAELV